jgi:hypothetical protein
MLRDSMKPSSPSKERQIRLSTYSNNPLVRIILIAVVAGIGVGAYAGYHVLRPTPYRASDDGFSIVFPAAPTINTIPTSSDDNGGKESGRIYDSIDKKQDAGYIVYVIHDTKDSARLLSQSGSKAALIIDAGQLASVEKADISSYSFASFKGVTALKTSFTAAPTASKTTYLLAFLHGNNVYLILGNGMSSTKFTSFTDTFRFI